MNIDFEEQLRKLQEEWGDEVAADAPAAAASAQPDPAEEEYARVIPVDMSKFRLREDKVSPEQQSPTKLGAKLDSAPLAAAGEKALPSEPDWNRLKNQLQNAQLEAFTSRASDHMFENIVPGFKSDPGRHDLLVKSAAAPLEVQSKKNEWQRLQSDLAGNKQNQALREQQISTGAATAKRTAEANDPASAASKKAREAFKAFFGNTQLPPEFEEFSANEVKALASDPASMFLKLKNARDVAELRKKSGAGGDPEADANFRAALKATGLYDDLISKWEQDGSWEHMGQKQLKDLLKPVETRQLDDRRQPQRVAVAAATHEANKNIDQDAALESLAVGWSAAPDFKPSNEMIKKHNDVVVNTSKIGQAVTELRQLYKKMSALDRRLPVPTAERTRIKSLVQDIKDDVRVLKNFGVPSGKDMEQIANSISDPTDNMSVGSWMADFPAQLDAMDHQLGRTLKAQEELGFVRAPKKPAAAAPKQNGKSHGKVIKEIGGIREYEDGWLEEIK